MNKKPHYIEACPVCMASVDWGFNSGAHEVTCGECHVPLVIVVPFFKQTASGYVLKVSPKAMATLREAYRI